MSRGPMGLSWPVYWLVVVPLVAMLYWWFGLGG
jgi:hypothetical protein